MTALGTVLGCALDGVVVAGLVLVLEQDRGNIRLTHYQYRLERGVASSPAVSPYGLWGQVVPVVNKAVNPQVGPRTWREGLQCSHVQLLLTAFCVSWSHIPVVSLATKTLGGGAMAVESS